MPAGIDDERNLGRSHTSPARREQPPRIHGQRAVDRHQEGDPKPLPLGPGAPPKVSGGPRKGLRAGAWSGPGGKKRRPFLPGSIGGVPSPGGAVTRDIRHRLAERFPRRVLIWPVAVQGDGAAEQIAAAIAGFNGIVAGGKGARPELLIPPRRGGRLPNLPALHPVIVVPAPSPPLPP